MIKKIERSEHVKCSSNFIIHGEEINSNNKEYVDERFTTKLRQVKNCEFSEFNLQVTILICKLQLFFCELQFNFANFQI